MLGVIAQHRTVVAPYLEFAKRLEGGMKRSGIRAAAIVAELKVDAETVRLWLRGQRMPRDPKLTRLAKMIGVDPRTLRYGDEKALHMPAMEGELVTDEDELALLRAYRGLKKEWAREALRRRAVELLEEFGEPGTANPFRAPGTS